MLFNPQSPPTAIPATHVPLSFQEASFKSPHPSLNPLLPFSPHIYNIVGFPLSHLAVKGKPILPVSDKEIISSQANLKLSLYLKENPML